MRKLSILGLMFFFSFSCIQEKIDYMKIGTNVWPGYEPLYLARELGFFDRFPIHIVEYGSTTQVIRAYRNGIINSAGLTLDETLLLKNYGFDPVIVLVMDISHGADVIIARKGIKSIYDLKGKKIGVENTALGAYMLLRALEIHKLTPNDLKIVPLEVNEHYKWFKEGKIDAVVTFEPVKSKLLKIGGNIIFDSSQIPGEIVDVLVVERSYLEKNPEIVKRVIHGWFRAVAYMKNHRKRALKVISEREHITIEDLQKAYNGMIIPDRKENLILLNKGEPKLKKVAKKLLTIMKKQKIISNTNIKIDELFYSNFIRHY